MKVIVVKKSLKRFLVEINTHKLVKEVAILVARRRNSEAVARLLANGRVEGQIPDNIKDIKADVILTENGG